MSVEAITWALKTDTGSSTSKAILLVLANYADIHGVCWPSFESIAKRAECSVSSVQRAVAAMEEKGLLQRTRLRRQDGQLGAYRVTLAMPIGAVEEVCDSPETPPVNLTAGVKHPPVNLTTGQSDHRSNATSPPVKLTALEPNKTSSSLRSEEEPSGSAVLRAHEPPCETSEWPSRLREAQARAGSALNLTTGGAQTFVELRRLCEPATGHPCDWDRDVLPAIDELAASFAAKRQQFRSWVIITETAIRNRDRRLAGLPDPVQPEPAHANDLRASQRLTQADVYATLAARARGGA
jgi:hypothetical protein